MLGVVQALRELSLQRNLLLTHPRFVSALLAAGTPCTVPRGTSPFHCSGAAGSVPGPARCVSLIERMIAQGQESRDQPWLPDCWQGGVKGTSDQISCWLQGGSCREATSASSYPPTVTAAPRVPWERSRSRGRCRQWLSVVWEKAGWPHLCCAGHRLVREQWGWQRLAAKLGEGGKGLILLQCFVPRGPPGCPWDLGDFQYQHQTELDLQAP